MGELLFQLFDLLFFCHCFDKEDVSGARERLLRHLLDQGVAVTGFGAARERLQEAYMAGVRAADLPPGADR